MNVKAKILEVNDRTIINGQERLHSREFLMIDSYNRDISYRLTITRDSNGETVTLQTIDARANDPDVTFH